MRLSEAAMEAAARAEGVLRVCPAGRVVLLAAALVSEYSAVEAAAMELSEKKK